jgi:hypothetical protein
MPWALQSQEGSLASRDNAKILRNSDCFGFAFLQHLYLISLSMSFLVREWVEVFLGLPSPVIGGVIFFLGIVSILSITYIHRRNRRSKVCILYSIIALYRHLVCTNAETLHRVCYVCRYQAKRQTPTPAKNDFGCACVRGAANDDYGQSSKVCWQTHHRDAP